VTRLAVGAKNLLAIGGAFNVQFAQFNRLGDGAVAVLLFPIITTCGEDEQESGKK